MRYLTLFILLLLSFLGFSNAEFSKLTTELQAAVTNIEKESGRIEQKIEEVEAGILLFTSTSISSKGVTKVSKYQLSISDIDQHMVKEFTAKDVIYVQLKVIQNQKFIEYMKDGNLLPYVNMIKINATDIDNARNIRDLIKKMIPIAKEIQKSRINAPSYSDKLDFIQKNIEEVSIGNSSFNQVITFDQDQIGKMTVELTKPSGKSMITNKYILNLADLNENAVTISVRGTKINLNIETNRNQKLINYFKDNIPGSYVSSIQFLAKNIDQARDVSTVLKETIPLAKEKVDKSMPTAKNASELLKIVNANIAEIVIDDKVHTQNFDEKCITAFTTVTPGSKESVNQVFKFNFSDLNEHSIDYKISGKKMNVVCSTNSEKLIGETKNDAQMSYRDNISILCKGADEARIISFCLNNIIENCKENIQRLVPDGGAESKLKWLSDNINEVKIDSKVYQQSFAKSEVDDKKYELKTVTVSGSSANEMLYQMNLADIDPNKVVYKISGKSLSIQLETNYGAKVIKTYKNGEVGAYTGMIQVYFKDVELARSAITAFKEIIEEKAKKL